MKVALLPQAKADLSDISGPLLTKVLKRLEALRNYPQLGSALTGHLDGYRSTIVAALRIVYTVSAETVVVSYVRHCRRS